MVSVAVADVVVVAVRVRVSVLVVVSGADVVSDVVAVRFSGVVSVGDGVSVAVAMTYAEILAELRTFPWSRNREQFFMREQRGGTREHAMQTRRERWSAHFPELHQGQGIADGNPRGPKATSENATPVRIRSLSPIFEERIMDMLDYELIAQKFDGQKDVLKSAADAIRSLKST